MPDKIEKLVYLPHDAAKKVSDAIIFEALKEINQLALFQLLAFSLVPESIGWLLLLKWANDFATFLVMILLILLRASFRSSLYLYRLTTFVTAFYSYDYAPHW